METFDRFLLRLKTQAPDCELSTLKDELIKDMIVIGTSDSRLKDQLLRKTDLKLADAVKYGKSAEVTRKNLALLKDDSEKRVHQLSKINKKGAKKNDKSDSRKNRDEVKTDVINNCRFCSYSHKRGRCPAFNRKCNNCGEKGHFGNRCPENDGKDVKHIENHSSDSNSSSDEDIFFIKEISGIGDEDDQLEDIWNVDLDVCGTMVTFKIDTGAQVNVLPKSQYNKLLKRPKLLKSSTKLKAYNGSSIPVAGKCIVTVTHGGESTSVSCVVAEIEAVPILGLKTSASLRLIERVMSVENVKVPAYVSEYADCFGELGTLPKKHHITIDRSVKPVVHAPRRIPIVIKDKLKTTIDKMEKLNVIEKITEPTDWVSSMVVVEKANGNLRICLDPKDLNKAIKREYYHMPTAEEIFGEMKGAKFFTKMDASNAYWQIVVDEESSKLLTFNTPFGRYKFKRLPFGIHSASEICQQQIGHILENIEGCANAQDDIIIWGKDRPELVERTKAVLTAVKKSGLKLNAAKCVYEVRDLQFLGHKISGDGIQVDPDKTDAIMKMEYPKDKKELQRFLGTINYLGKFIPNLSDETAILRTLLKKENLWSFDSPHMKSVDRLKELVSSSPVLKFFDSRRETRVTTDASKEGLGALLEQKFDDGWHPIAYGSRSLTKSEVNYAPIELETLAVVFACNRFNVYLYGRRFTVKSDHQPLKSIFSSVLANVPPRLQRFLLSLQKYDFDVEYVKGVENVVADAFSRNPLPNDGTEINEEDLSSYVHLVVSMLPISSEKFEELVEATKEDTALQLLMSQKVGH